MAAIEPSPQLAPETKRPPIEPPAKRAVAVVWAVVVALVGGVACGWCLDRYGTLGAISLWPLGAIAGFIAARLKLSGRFCGWALVAACLMAFLVAETYWIRWHEAEDWWEAVRYWPTFITEYEVPVLVGIVLAAFGAESAFRQTRRPSGSAAYTTRASG